MNKDDNLPYYVHDPSALDALKGEFGSFVDHLTRREFIIINLRYGISYTRKLSLQQIGILFNISRERVRQIETKVLRKLRTNKKSMEEIDYYISCPKTDIEEFISCHWNKEILDKLFKYKTYKFEDIDFNQLKKKIDQNPNYFISDQRDDLPASIERVNIQGGDDYELVVRLLDESSYDDVEGHGVYAQDITVDTSKVYEEGRFSSDIEGIKGAVQCYLDWDGPIEYIIQ